MEKSLFVLFVICVFTTETKGQSYEQKIHEFQKELNMEFLDSEESPLSKKERKKFLGHPFFTINEKYRVEAKFVRTNNSLPFQMKTTTDRLPTYEKYGEAIFEIDGKTLKLNIYQSLRLRKTEKYKNYLFLPFTDLTNGDETYGGGRYVDLQIPTGETIVIDFNKSYNPSCAYNHSFSCPIPPKENDLDIRIIAGVKNLEL